MTVRRLQPYAVTIFAEMSALAARIGAVNLGQRFPDEDGPPAMLKIAANVLQGNRRGIVLHRDGDAPYQLEVGSNTFWDNGQDVENLRMPQEALTLDPQLVRPEAGQFSAAAPPVVAARHGLSEETSTASLWKRWQQLAQPSE